MLSPQALMRGLVRRYLPSAPGSDSINNDAAIRQFPYGEVCTQPMVRKAHNLCDEGSYWVTNNGVTGIVPTVGTGLVATSPFITIYNSNVAGGPLCYLDYIDLINTANVTAASGIASTAAAVVIDPTNRYTSGGTSLTGNIVNTNMSVASASGVAVVCGAIVSPAASPLARTLVGFRNIRPAVSGTQANVVGDQHLLNFGGVENNASGNITVANVNILPQSLPPVIIGPGQSALLYLWWPGITTPAGGGFAPEVGFWVR